MVSRLHEAVSEIHVSPHSAVMQEMSELRIDLHTYGHSHQRVFLLGPGGCWRASLCTDHPLSYCCNGHLEQRDMSAALRAKHAQSVLIRSDLICIWRCSGPPFRVSFPTLFQVSVFTLILETKQN